MSDFERELKEEELMKVRAGIQKNVENIDDILDGKNIEALQELKNSIQDRKLSLEELTKVKAAQPTSEVENMIDENSELFRKH